MPTAQAILSAADALGRLIDDHPFAEENPQAIAALRRLCAELRKHDPRAGDIAIQICANAQIFYSRWSRVRMNHDPVALYTEMRVDLIQQLRALATELIDEDTD